MSTQIKTSILKYLTEEGSEPTTDKMVHFHSHLAKEFSGMHPREIRTVLTELANEGMVSISGDYNSLGASYQGVVQNLSNLHLSGKITEKGAKFLEEHTPNEVDESEEEPETHKTKTVTKKANKK